MSTRALPTPAATQWHAGAGAGDELAPRAAYRLTAGLIAATVLLSTLALAFPGWLTGIPSTVGSARGTAFVLLAIDVPLLVVGAGLASRGSLRGLVVWLGATGYAAYNGVIFATGLEFGRLFLPSVAVLGLAFWTLVVLLAHIDAARVAAAFGDRLPVRAIGGYLVVVAALFALTWMRDILPAVIDGTSSRSVAQAGTATNPVEVVDLAVSLPATALAGWWLWQRRAWGYVLAGLMLVLLAVEGVSIAVDQWWAHVADPAMSLGAVPAFVVLTLVELIPLGVYLARLGGPAAPTSAPTR